MFAGLRLGRDPLGGKLSDFRDVEGRYVPFSIVAGNMFGTPDYFHVFKANVTSIKYSA